MEIGLLKGELKAKPDQTLVVFLSQFDAKKGPVLNKHHGAVSTFLKNIWKSQKLTGAKKEFVLFRNASILGFENLAVVGLGKTLNAEAARVAASVAYQGVKGNKIMNSLWCLEGLLRGTRDDAALLQGLAEGALLSDYEYNELKSKSKKDAAKAESKEEFTINFHYPKSSSGFDKIMNAAHIVTTCQNLTRRLGDTPANLMTPTQLANEAVAAAKGTSMKVTVWNKDRIRKERFGGLLGVSEGSSQEPRFVIMEYNGAGKGKAPLALVGKGLTFDCGGISIKPSANMEEMKYDMCGAGAVIGAMAAIARLKLKVNVVGYVLATENMPGPSATKPGDVHTARNGMTFEVNNTDAEGRLVLADGLSYACEQKPAAIVDLATLTGAIVVALGNIYTGVFTRDPKFYKKLELAAAESGELIWNMPLNDYHVEDMKGTFGDLNNMGLGRGAGSSTAAAFLESFVDKEIPWIHLDIAGTAWNVSNRQNYHPKKGASGIMVRTLVELAKQF